MTVPLIVAASEWLAARKELLAAEAQAAEAQAASAPEAVTAPPPGTAGRAGG
jgi:predicted dithiol-disulfide oxidoreductase (DUF899 family)